MGHLKLMGISVFHGPRKVVNYLINTFSKIDVSNSASKRKELGFYHPPGERPQEPSLSYQVQIKNIFKLTKLNSLDSFPLTTDSEGDPDFETAFKAIASLIEENAIPLLLIDSPHSEEKSSKVRIQYYDWKKIFPGRTSYLTFSVAAFYNEVDRDSRSQLFLGTNLSPWGAKLFTFNIAQTILNQSKLENRP
jgi:hypothetical protein